MRMRMIAALGFGLAAWGARADTNAAGGFQTLEKFAGGFAIPSGFAKGTAERLREPVLQKQLADMLAKKFLESDHTNALFGLINDFHLKFKVFEAAGSAGNAALGFEYDYEKSVVSRTIHPGLPNPLGLSFAFHARGNVAFDQSRNPDDFLDTGFKLHLWQARGGIVPIVNTTGLNLPEIQDKLLTDFGKIPAGAHWKDDPRWRALSSYLDDYVRPQFLWDLAANGALESNQTFSKKQWAYGGQLGLSYRDWKSTSGWCWANLLDYPFAFVRYITTDAPFKPSGHAFPTLLAGLDMVDASHDPDRNTLDPGEDTYARFRGEIAFKTQVGRIATQDLWFSAGYRIFQELNPPSLIRQADMASFNYFVASLGYHGFSLNYSTGKLPLDRKNDSVYGLGYSIQF